MAGVKISALPAVASALLTDFFPVVQAGVTSKETLQQVNALFGFDPVTAILAPSKGGTGVNNNNANTITLSGALTTTGAFSPTLNFAGSGTYTFPAASQTMLGLLGGTISAPILYASTPVGSTELVNKAYVDAIAQGLSPKPASQAATTANLNTIYANGTAGVGATLTDAAGTFLAFAVDGYSASVGDQILVKDQSTTFQNGLYILTTNGDGVSIPYVLTRSVNMDQPSEFLGGFTFVLNGTANGNKSFVETATVVTVGSSAVTFSQFGASGTVNTGAINDLAYYAATGNAVSGLATANSGVLVTSAGGVPSISTTLPNALAMGTPASLVLTNATGLVSAGVAAQSGAGIPVQIAVGTVTTTVTISGSTYADVTGMSVSITPSASTSKVLVRAVCQVGTPLTDAAYLQLVRGSTPIGIATSTSTRTAASGVGSANNANTIITVVMEWLDSPATTSSTTYKVQMLASAGNSVYLNRSSTDTDSSVFARTASMISVMEIK